MIEWHLHVHYVDRNSKIVLIRASVLLESNGISKRCGSRINKNQINLSNFWSIFGLENTYLLVVDHEVFNLMAIKIKN